MNGGMMMPPNGSGGNGNGMNGNSMNGNSMMNGNGMNGNSMMNMNSESGDLIENLPVDKNFLHSERQMQIAETLFKQNETLINVLARELKDGFIICALFIIFSSTQVDTFIKKFVQRANDSFLILIGIKCIGLVLVYYLIKNFNLTKRS